MIAGPAGRRESSGGVCAVGVGPAVDGDARRGLRSAVAGRLFGDRGEPVQCGALGGDGAFELVDPPVALAHAFVVGALQGGESLDLVFEFDLLT